MNLLNVVALAGVLGAAAAPADLFTERVQPILRKHCFECHAHTGTIKGGLALDSASGLRLGGEGGPIIVPGAPEKSRLITAVQHSDPSFKMPPKAKLSADEIAALADWVRQGAVDRRGDAEGPAVAGGSTDSDAAWEALYQQRLTWWSLQPLAESSPPAVADASWPRNEVDHFILSALESAQLRPAPEADARTLARRLSFALTGLPPSVAQVEAFAADPSEAAYSALVEELLASPHFGERWARHWMDVVHYADTHGYEWDAPAKNAWRYRDYLIRALNEDVPYRQLILEQIAGDLIPPRVDPETGLNAAIIGPMALRLGERRHGDNGDAEGVTQEAVANMIDTMSKGFLATTVACAQCHDHKLDAVGQADYYSLAGVLMSSRWSVRSAETADPNGAVIDRMKVLKESIREELGDRWRESAPAIANILLTPAPDPEAAEKSTDKAEEPPAEPAFPESLPAVWQYLQAKQALGVPVEEAWRGLAAEFASKHADRAAGNAANLRLIADFTLPEPPRGWTLEGLGMKHGLVSDGALVIAEEGESAVAHLLPAGRWTHVWSKRLAGAVRSSLFARDPAPAIAVEYAGGDYAAQALIVDKAFHSERMKFLKQPLPGWLTLDTGNLAALAGGTDPTPRDSYLELVTKSLNNYYPPRDRFGGLPREAEDDPRSWFGLTRAYEVTPGYTPADELNRLAPLFEHAEPPATPEAAAERITDLVIDALDRWGGDRCDSGDVRLINEALHAGWLPNTVDATPRLRELIADYRQAEQALQPDRTIGSAEDAHEGRDARLAVRGSYTTLGDEVPRGTIRFLGGPGSRAYEGASGRLELARNFTREDNPLTARVYVNRVCHHLFGAGIVRTVDDFGHLGETPSHPELLDWLAKRFMAEGWSTKQLIRMLVTSSAWRQASAPDPAAFTADPENRLWHHMPLRRLEAEAVRDAILAASGRLDPALYGPPINPHRVAEDPTKRLFAGPLDGDGRRSIYQKMTMMEPPRFLALFNQPIPKLTQGRRDTSNVPNQALALLNDPFVVAMAEHWGARVVAQADESAESRIAHMFHAAFARPPQPEETARFAEFAVASAELRGADPADLMACAPVWRDVAHAIFNLKEFIYVP